MLDVVPNLMVILRGKMVIKNGVLNGKVIISYQN